MKKRRREDLIKFFKSKLDEKYPIKENWNTPADDIFFDALQSIHVSKREKRYAYYKHVTLLLLFITAMIISFYTYKYISSTNTKMDALEQTITKLETDQNNKSIESNLTSTIQNSKDKLVNADVLDFNNSTTDSNPLVNSISSNSNSFSGLSHDQSNQFQFELQNNGIEEIYSKNIDKQNVSGSSIYSNSGGLDLDKNLIFLNRLGIDALNLSSNELQSPKSIILESGDLKQSKLKLGFYLANDWSAISMSNIQLSNMQSLEKYNIPKRNVGFGASLSYELTSRLSLSTSIGYGNYNYISEFDEDFNYDKSNELLENNELIYPMEMEIQTPLGSYEAYSKLAIGNNQFDNSDRVASRSKINQSFRLLKIELGGQYKILSSDKWNLSINSGFAYNHVNNMDHDMKTSIKIDKNVVGELKSRVDKMNGDKASFISVYNRLGLSYQFNKNFELMVSGGYNTSITSAVDKVKTNNQGSYFNDFQSRLGINYTF